MGGSGGARTINQAMKQNLDELHNKARLQIIWQCGSRYYDALSEEIDLENYPNLRLTDFPRQYARGLCSS